MEKPPFPDHPLTGEAAMQYVEQSLGWPRDVLLAFPKFVLIDPLNQCNARCIMCGVEPARRKKKLVLPDELFAKILDELAAHAGHLERVGLFIISEPLLDPHLEDKIRALKRIGIKCTYLNSNGSLLDAERGERLIRTGLDRIHISIDSLIPKRYESIRRGLKFKTVHDNTLEFIRTRNRLNPNLMIRVQMILQEMNQDEGEAFRDYWLPKLLPTDGVVVTRAFNWGRANDVVHSPNENHANFVPCTALWSTFEIWADGIVRLCSLDVDGAVVLGDIREKSIAEMWHGEELSRVRQFHLAGEREKIVICDHCTTWYDYKHTIKTSGRT